MDNAGNLFMGGEFTDYINSSSLPMLNPGGGAYYDDTPNGGDDSFILKFVPCVLPPVANFSVNDSIICAGTCVTFTDLTTNYPLSWKWTFHGGTPTSSIQKNPAVCYDTAGTYKVTLIAGNTLGTDTIIKTLFVNVLALPTVIVTPALTSICGNSSDTLVASGATTYTWAPAAGLNITTGNTVIVSPTTTTNYTVTGTTGECTATSMSVITINPVLVASITTGNTLICAGTLTELTAIGGTNYLWSTSATTQSITVSPTTVSIYSVTVSVGNCFATANIKISILNNPTVSAGADQTILPGGSVQLTGSGNGTYSWSPGTGLSCTDCANPIVIPIATTTYCITVTDLNGCTNNDCVVVTVNEIKCGEVFVPNSFSPNNDNQNELECVYGKCITEIYFVIFDRWGERVFKTTDPKQCWDGTFRGKPLNTAVFVYYLEATLDSGEKIKKKGNINLVR